MRRPACALAALVSVGTGAVNAGATPASRSTSVVAARDAASSGCGARARTGSTTLTLGTGAHQRTAIVHVPSAYNSSRGVALVLNLHGSGSTAVAQEVFSGMDATSDQRSFIVAYPQGLIPSGTGFDWNIPGVPLFGGGTAPRGSANDVAFLTQLVPVLESKYCINPREVFATGMSGGGRMASQLTRRPPSQRSRLLPAFGSQARAQPPVLCRSSLSTGPQIRSTPMTGTARRTGPIRSRLRHLAGRRRTSAQELPGRTIAPGSL
jgi:polyhydroxybutyrate depolymerase